MSIYPKGYYVYAYIRENGIPYYIGKGKHNRAYVIHKRKDGVKINPPNRERIIICEQNLTATGAAAIERRLIRWYGRKIDGGVLVNMTMGGDGGGVLGHTMSIEQREKLRQINLGKKKSPESIEKTASKNRGKKRSDETRQRISESQKGKVIPDDQRQKMRESKLKKPTRYWLGKTQEKKECPHCGKSVVPGMFTRWHGVNCRFLYE